MDYETDVEPFNRAAAEWKMVFDKVVLELEQCRADLATVTAERDRLQVQWDEHCAFHGSESPHALNEAQYRASDAESHCKALAEDVSRLRRENTNLLSQLHRAESPWGQG